MKLILTNILVRVLLTAVPSNAGWFDKEERERRIQTEQQLDHQRQSTGHWQFAATILSVTCVILLVVGAAIGAKARKEARDEP
jgi:hypothetical protein